MRIVLKTGTLSYAIFIIIYTGTNDMKMTQNPSSRRLLFSLLCVQKNKGNKIRMHVDKTVYTVILYELGMHSSTDD